MLQKLWNFPYVLASDNINTYMTYVMMWAKGFEDALNVELV